MRIVTWNIHRCFGSDGKHRPDRVLEVLRALCPDVIALQEIDSSLRVDGGVNQLDYLALGLNMSAEMGPTLRRDYGAYGNAILSRFEIVSCEECDLSFRRLERRGAIALSLATPAGPLRVINTHLGLTYGERASQIDCLLANVVWRDEKHVVLAGDFNEWIPFSGNNLRLERAFTTKSPRLATFPSRWPRLALDRIFLSGTTTSASFKAFATEKVRLASDHLAVMAEFEMV